jgi:hypothetical protein
VAILKKEFFFLLQSKRTGRRKRTCLGGLVPMEEGEDVGKGCKKVNIVQILCTHVYKWKNECC